MSVDSVRVDFAAIPSLPGTSIRSIDAGDASRLEIAAGPFARAVRIADAGASGLRFDPPLVGASFKVTLDAQVASRGACVAKITLLGGGRELASVTP